MTTQRIDVAIGDDQDSLTNTGAGTLTADHIVRLEYDDTATTLDLHNALTHLRDKITQLEE
jgi:hypothetical protein